MLAYFNAQHASLGAALSNAFSASRITQAFLVTKEFASSMTTTLVEVISTTYPKAYLIGRTEKTVIGL
jgi:hypothetical protein